jgi:hypothetical protein
VLRRRVVDRATGVDQEGITVPADEEPATVRIDDDGLGPQGNRGVLDHQFTISIDASGVRPRDAADRRRLVIATNAEKRMR